MKYRLAVVLLTLAGSSMAATEMYSWIDANGVKHFSDSPPPASVKAKKMVVHGGVGANAGAVTEAPPAVPAAADSGPALAAAAGYAPQDISRNCDIARANLITLEAQKPKLDDAGNPADAVAAQSHQAQVDKANQQIKLFCAAK